jgi:molybdopterin molybdotransferase
MISFEEAQEIVRSQIPEPATERVALDEASGRFAAEAIQATFDLPRFTNSAMDGFAIRSADIQGSSRDNPVELDLVGTVVAGDPGDLDVGKGQCAQCMTGAPIPRGADAIAIVETTTGFSDSKRVSFFREYDVGANIRVRGEEVTAGADLIAPGVRLGAAEIGVSASFGHAHLTVTRRPKIAIFATGSELLEPGQPLRDGAIYNSNLYVLSDLVTRAGGDVICREVVPDDPASLESFLAKALDEADIVVSSGGVSMGKEDWIRRVLLSLGVEEHFWKVAQKPGKPLFFGGRAGTLFFGLPGNPVSCFIGFLLFVGPTLCRWMGHQPAAPISGTLTAPFPRDARRHRFLFGRSWHENGILLCAPTDKAGSHMLTSSLQANCILGAPPSPNCLEAGAVVDVRPIRSKLFG